MTMKKKQTAAAPRRLQSDFTYSTPYREDGDGGDRFIHAYSTQAEGRKRQFLEDARSSRPSAASWSLGSEMLAEKQKAVKLRASIAESEAEINIARASRWRPGRCT